MQDAMLELVTEAKLFEVILTSHSCANLWELKHMILKH